MAIGKPAWVDLAQWITAVVSLVIATLSIWLGYESRTSDIEYRELQIRPALRLEVSSDPPRMTIKNVGLGPAKISGLRYRLGAKDVIDDIESSSNIDVWPTEPNRQNQSKLVRLIVNEDAYLKVNKSLPPLQLDVSYPSPGDIIPVGEEVVFIKISNIHEIELAAAAAKASFELDKWKDSVGFSERGALGITYCSLTGQYCNNTKDGQIPQKLP